MIFVLVVCFISLTVTPFISVWTISKMTSSKINVNREIMVVCIDDIDKNELTLFKNIVEDGIDPRDGKD